MPLEAESSWEWFIRLSGQRQAGFALLPFSWSDLQAFFDLHGYRPTPFELRLIQAFDRAYLEVFAPKEPKK